MVGEIRDLETGGIAGEGALTGHLVLSTLHTNSAPETLTRLLDMGLEPFNVSSALNLILASGSCAGCARSAACATAPTARVRRRQGHGRHAPRRPAAHAGGDRGRARAGVPDDGAAARDVTPETRVGDLAVLPRHGCDACTGTGLKGRQGLYEVMVMTPKLRRLVLTGRRRRADPRPRVDEGMLTLRMDGWLKVLRGITTIEQIVRETSA
jgi:type IV pilus assembly protein PilB